MLENIKFKKGCRKTFDELYSCYAAALYGVICREVEDSSSAQKILQNVFVRIWNSMDQYDASQSRLFTWMLGICY